MLDGILSWARWAHGHMCDVAIAGWGRTAWRSCAPQRMSRGRLRPSPPWRLPGPRCVPPHATPWCIPSAGYAGTRPSCPGSFTRRSLLCPCRRTSTTVATTASLRVWTLWFVCPSGSANVPWGLDLARGIPRVLRCMPDGGDHIACLHGVAGADNAYRPVWRPRARCRQRGARLCCRPTTL